MEREGIDAADPIAFQRSRLNRALRHEGRHRLLWEFYRRLLQLRRETPALRTLDKKQTEVVPLDHHEVVVLRRWSEANDRRNEVVAVFNLSGRERTVEFNVPAGHWRRIFDSAQKEYGGPDGLAANDLLSDGVFRMPLRAWQTIVWQRT